jgi:uncharacterized protein (TIGR03437 family)
MTGGGALSQSYADGQIVDGTAATLAALVNPPQVTFGSLNYGAPQGQVVYAGQAPDLVAGAIQVNFIVPLNAPTGPAVSVYVLVPGPAFTSYQAAAVTLALR